MKVVFCLLCIVMYLIPWKVEAYVDSYLVISQVQITGGTGATNNDFIEIYNPTGGDIELFGHGIYKRTKTGTSDIIVALWTQSTIIPAGKFYLISHVDFTSLGVTPDKTFVESISNDNGIALKSPDNQVVDSLGWGEATNAFVEGVVFGVNPTANNAISRKFEGVFPVDTGDNSQDFEIKGSNPRNTSFVWPEPEEEPEEVEELEEEVQYSNAVKISEFLPNPSGEDSGFEWIEIYSSEDADISGWILDDEGEEVGSSAFVIPDNTHITAGAYLVFQIPANKFALNNSGGDSVRLFFPNHNLADSVSYEGVALQSQSYAQSGSGFSWTSIVTKGGVNQFPEVVEEEFETEVLQEIEYSQEILITELMPNPKGTDAGNEFVEIFNTGSVEVNLKNWILDDGVEDDPIGSNSYKLSEIYIKPGQYISFQIPKNKFTMNNSGIESIRLLNPSKNVVSIVEYEGSEEGKSLSLLEEEWIWTESSLGFENSWPEEVTYSDEVYISSVLPEPDSGQEEYIEISNPTDVDISLEGWVISDASRNYVIKDLVVEAGGSIKILKSQSQISLNNFGSETVTLTNPLGEVVSEVEYEDPGKGELINFSDGQISMLPRTGGYVESIKHPKLPVIVFSLAIWYIYIVFSSKNKEI